MGKEINKTLIDHTPSLHKRTNNKINLDFPLDGKQNKRRHILKTFLYSQNLKIACLE